LYYFIFSNTILVMRKYSHKTIESLKKDRVNGLSIPKLMAKYNMPKTSIWHHVSNIILHDDIKQKIRSEQGGSKARKEKYEKEAKKKAQLLLKNIDIKNSDLLIFIGLYWSEGSKDSFVFTNTDIDILNVFIKISQKVFNINKDELTALIRITNKMNADDCIKYWQSVLGLPKKNIHANISIKHNKTKTDYGICRITLKKGGYRLKVVNALIKEVKSIYKPL